MRKNAEDTVDGTKYEHICNAGTKRPIRLSVPTKKRILVYFRSVGRRDARNMEDSFFDKRGKERVPARFLSVCE